MVLDVTQAEGESEVEPYCLVNDLRRGTISAVADFRHAHRATALSKIEQADAGVTKPVIPLLPQRRPAASRRLGGNLLSSRRWGHSWPSYGVWQHCARGRQSPLASPIAGQYGGSRRAAHACEHVRPPSTGRRQRPLERPRDRIVSAIALSGFPSARNETISRIARSLVATFCAAAAFRVFGGMRQRSLRCDASDRIANCVSVSLAATQCLPRGAGGDASELQLCVGLKPSRSRTRKPPRLSLRLLRSRRTKS